MSYTSHRRYSSTDSLNGSNHSDHSRQGSDSAEANYPTRRMSAQMTRKSSTTADPLQFLKGKLSTSADLAETAEVQMRIAAESKKMASEVKVPEEDSIDWQANLSTWKNRRKSQSERSYQLKEDLERMEKEKEQASGLTTKTFSQMQEEREKRKISSRHFYPINDDEDDDIFGSRKQTDTDKSKSDVLQSMHKPKAEVAPWARDSPDSKAEKDDNGEGEFNSGSDDDVNNNDKENAINRSKNNSFLHSSPSSEWKSLDSDQVIQRTQAVQQHSNIPQSRQTHVDSKSNDMFKSSVTNVGPRTQSKIGSLMQNFQQGSSKNAVPKEGYKESIDLSARKNIFEQYGDDDLNERNAEATQIKEPNWSQYNRFNRRDQEDSSNSANDVHQRSSPSVKEGEKEDKLIQVEKTIKIKQKPNNDKGFGFFLTGGADQGRPLCVSKVSLGSAADLCELKVKDEILRVNQTDANGKTAGEVGDIIGRAVSAGVIELKVKRTCTADELDEEEDEEMTSSSDEGEEDLTPSNSHTNKNEQSTVSSKREDMQRAPDSNNDRMEINVQGQNFSTPPPPHHTEDSGKDEEDGPPAILRKWQRQRQREEYTFDAGPTTDYKKISLNAGLPSELSDSKPKMNEDSVSGNYPQPNMSWDDRLNEWTSKQDKERRPDPMHSSSHGADGQSQYEARQEEMKSAYEESLRSAEKMADERMKQEQSFLQPEMDKARILEERRLERRNRIQETAAALSSQAQPSTSSPPSFSNLPLPSSFLPSSSTSSSSLAPKPWQPSNSPDITNANASFNPSSAFNSHTTSMTFDVGAKSDVSTPVSYAFPKQQGVIVIDPRNQAQQNAAPIEFQVKLPPKQELDQNSQSFLEAERERIRQEERRKVEEERIREQREWEAKQEELRKIEEKERELREKEERFRQEREQFQREQEEFKRIREQQLKEQQQLQYQGEQKQSPHPHPLQQQPQIQPQYQSQNQSSHSIYQNIYPDSQQFQNYHQHMSQSSQPLQSTLDPAVSSQYSRGSSGSPTYYQNNTSNTQSSYTKPVRGNTQPERPRAYKQGNSPVYSQTHSPDGPDQGRYQRDEQVTGGRFSKEDMLAMNRKAKGDFDPIRKSSENHLYQQQQQQLQQPMQQRVPSPNAKDPNQPKGHSLNSAPKARLRDDKEWQDTNRQPSRTGRGREDGNQPRRSPYGNGQEHWLVQEAERRRLAESSSHVRGQAVINPGPILYPGPIKPQNDDVSNRWRNNTETSPSMPRAIRQTLLEKTSTPRGPDNENNGFHKESTSPHYQQPYQPQHQHQQQIMSHQHQNPRSLSPRNNTSYYSPPQDQQSKGSPHMPSDPINRYSPSSGHPPSNFPKAPTPRQTPSNYGEGGYPVNGHQLCSHCNQELGFGAAMVIESLGIFFHLQCFRCCVCHASLGTGSQGADVRVRMNKLHCPNCYSNDEGRWQSPTNYQSRKIWIEIQ